MVQNFINFITGKQINQDDASIRETNRIEMEIEKVKLELELSQIANRMIHRI